MESNCYDKENAAVAAAAAASCERTLKGIFALLESFGTKYSLPRILIFLFVSSDKNGRAKE